jgi:crossover junction endodeoxyribonuclease RuvC
VIYIGIDPGAKGAMALLDDNARLPEIIPFNKEEYIDRLRLLFYEEAECICCIESVHALPRQGVASTWAFGQSYGWLLGMLDTLCIPYQPITPQKWKKEFGLNSDKAKSVEVCKQLFPGINLLRTERSRKEDDGLAEASLMALYARRKF